MGITSAIQGSCLPGEDEEEKAIFLDKHGKEINDDYTFFQQEYWYRLQGTILFDPNKFIFLCSNYKRTQLKLMDRWKIVDTKKFRNNDRVEFTNACLQEKWKYAIRKGVPIVYYKNIIEMLFGKNFALEQASKKYQTLLYEALKKANNKVELVTFREESEEAYITPFLNQEGIEAAKRVAFLISKTLNQVEYNPYIINVISLLLVFVSEADTYDIIYMMIEGSTSMSVERQESLRWHFSLTSNQTDKFAREFFKNVKKVSPSINTINDHLNTEGIDKFYIFNEIIGSFFIGYVPFPVVLRMFIVYLNEGVKVFYRFVYAILKMTGPLVRESTNTQQILRIIRTKLLVSLCDDHQVKAFFRLAYDLRFENLDILKKNEKVMLQSKRNTEEIIYYLPELEGVSEILSYQDLEKIWDFLPSVIKHYDAKKIFSTSEGDQTLNNMISELQKEILTLTIIECTNESVFGVFLAEKIKTQNEINNLKNKLNPSSSDLGERLRGSESSSSKLARIFSMKEDNQKNFFYFGSSENFVFTLAPLKQKYPSTGQNIFYCSYNENYFVIGGPSSTPALLIDESMVTGESYECPTYNNQPLHQGTSGEFRIKMIECFAIS